MSNKRFHVIGRGFNGWHATGVNISSSGGTLEDCPGCKGYVGEAINGALVYDADPIRTDPDRSSAYVSWVFGGPMVDPSLPPDGCRKFGADVRKVALRMSDGLEGAFRVFAGLAQDEEFGGLDYVGVGLFEALLRKIPGVKIGHVVDGAVAWES